MEVCGQQGPTRQGAPAGPRNKDMDKLANGLRLLRTPTRRLAVTALRSGIDTLAGRRKVAAEISAFASKGQIVMGMQIKVDGYAA